MNTENLNKENQERLLSTLQHNAFLEHNMQQENLLNQQIYMFAQIFKVTPIKDGNQWCALIGKDLQEGIAGFGDSPFFAISDLYDNFHKKGYGSELR